MAVNETRKSFVNGEETARNLWLFLLYAYVALTVGYFLFMYLFAWPVNPKRYLINSWPLYVVPIIGLLLARRAKK